ncbi:MAG: hypothetical protein K2X26_09960 [Chitinophagaceae bacterium]|nr:hypothetical protein [Chitinophagaceae bacterium]
MVNNKNILRLLEKQRDDLFEKLNKISITERYKQEYENIKAGKVFIFDNGEKNLLRELKALSQDTSFDRQLTDKLYEYSTLNTELLIQYFEGEIKKVLAIITDSGKLNEIQALFIEYDYYYHYFSCITCYGIQDYPIIETPRYITDEYDYNKQVLFIENGINFQPAWLDCSEFENLDYIGINYEVEDLFRLHSRVLLHNALDRLHANNQFSLFKNKPVTFFINEHDCEVMTLYRLE